MKQTVRAYAVKAFGSNDKAQRWLNKPCRALGGKTPLRVCETDIEAVMAELVRIEHGVFA